LPRNLLNYLEMAAYYNEIDQYCVQWLRNLIKAGLIAPGDVDERSIKEVSPDDVRGYRQVHLFAGLGGWSAALRLAGPCQPFSVAGRRKGTLDERHLWPDFHRLVQAARPVRLCGEQVSGAAGYAWLDGVAADLEREGYAVRAFDLPACAVGAPHRRNRLYWVAYTSKQSKRESQHQVGAEPRGDTRLDAGWSSTRLERVGDADQQRGETECQSNYRNGGSLGSEERELVGERSLRETWDDYALIGPDPQGKYRRVKPGVRLLAHGVPGRVAKLRALGNAIVPQIAAEVIRAWTETEEET